MPKEYATCPDGKCELKWVEWPEGAEDSDWYATCQEKESDNPCKNQGLDTCKCLVVIQGSMFRTKEKTGDPSTRNDVDWRWPFTPPVGGGKPSGLSKTELGKLNQHAGEKEMFSAFCACCKLKDGKPYFKD